jgi:flagellar FliL protein
MSSPTPAAPAAAPAPAKKSSKKLVILGAALLVLAGAGVVGYKQFAKEPEAEPAVEEQKAVVADPGVVDLEPFVVRLADPAGDRYFRLHVEIVLDQKVIAKRAGTGLGQVKLVDLVLELLSKKRASELVTVAGKETLREELRASVSALFAEEPLFDQAVDPAPASVLDVFFTEFLVQ